MPDINIECKLVALNIRTRYCSDNNVQQKLKNNTRHRRLKIGQQNGYACK